MLPGVTIVVRNVATGIARETVTNDARPVSRWPALQPGRYQVGGRAAPVSAGTARARSPSRSTRKRWSTSTLKVGELTETITVAAREDRSCRRRRLTLGKVVEEKQILELPLSGRNFTSLGLLTPGVHDARPVHHRRVVRRARAAPGQQQLPARRRGERVARRQHRAGAPERGRGAGVQDPDEQLLGGVRPQLGLGRAGGDQVGHQQPARQRLGVPAATTSSRRGTSSPRPIRRRSSRISSAGPSAGPVTIPGLYSGRNRTFFFGSFEGFRLTRGLTRQAVVATAQERAGDFSFPDQADPRSADRSAVSRATSFRQTASARRRGSCSTLMPLPNIAGVAAAPEQLRLVAVAGADLRPVHDAPRSHLQPEVVGVLPAFPAGQHRLQPVPGFGSGRLSRVSQPE